MGLLKTFFDKVKTNDTISAKDAYDEIVGKLMVKDLRGAEKTNNNLGAYDSESVFAGKIYPGCIYIFSYDAKTPTKYTYQEKNVYFTDSMPIVLITSFGNGVIRGINLNFCNKALKTLVLNLVQNLDPKYFERDAEILTYNKSLPLSKNILAYFNNVEKAEAELASLLQSQCGNVDYSIIFRTYSSSGIKHIRLIEPWQWEYLPFLEYTDMKGATLSAIQKITGISNVKM